MRVLIVGVNHQIQPARIMSASTNGKLEAFEQDKKRGSAICSGSVFKGAVFSSWVKKLDTVTILWLRESVSRRGAATQTLT
jgi:hypothetical protein